MAKQQPRILAFAGSLREHSYNKRVLKTALKGAENAGAIVKFVDLRDYPMPIYDGDDHEQNGFPASALEFQELLSNYDGLMIASPEYNASLPAALKNAFDWASRKSDKFGLGEVFKGKVAAIMTASPGSFGGIRCLGHLHDVLTILLVNTLPSQIAVTFVGDKFDGNSEAMTDEKTRKILEDLGASLADMLKKTHGKEETVESETSDISNKH